MARSHTADLLKRGAYASHSSSNSRPASVVSGNRQRSESRDKRINNSNTRSKKSTATFSPSGTALTTRSRGAANATLTSTLHNPFAPQNTHLGASNKQVTIQRKLNDTRNTMNNANKSSQSMSLSKSSTDINLHQKGGVQ
jgi:hypothetical protein